MTEESEKFGQKLVTKMKTSRNAPIKWPSVGASLAPPFPFFNRKGNPSFVIKNRKKPLRIGGSRGITPDSRDGQRWAALG